MSVVSPELPDEMDIGGLMSEMELLEPHLYVLDRYPDIGITEGKLNTSMLNDMTEEEAQSLYALSGNLADTEIKGRIEGRALADELIPQITVPLLPPLDKASPAEQISGIIDLIVKNNPDEDISLLVRDPERITRLYQGTPENVAATKEAYESKQLSQKVRLNVLRNPYQH